MIVQPVEEKAPERRYCGLSIHKGGLKERCKVGLLVLFCFSRVCSERTGDNGFKLKDVVGICN